MIVSTHGEVFRMMEEHALDSYPEEACGLLIGEFEDMGSSEAELSVLEVRSLGNAWEGSRKNRYLADPRALLEAEKEFAGCETGIVGFYHSHPDAPAWPSPFDLERAWPLYAYLILSVRAEAVEEARVWILEQDSRGFKEGKLKKLVPGLAL